MKKLILFLMILSVLVSCQTKDNQTEHSVIYVKDHSDETFAKALSFQFIALETSDSCLISNIKYIEMEADDIYILDDVNNQIYLFKKSGKFVRTIGERGEGPAEYMMPSCFHIDKERNELVVADPALQKLLHYDLKTFEYKSSQQTEYFEECAWLPTHDIAWVHGEGFQNSKRGRFYIKITDDKLNFKTYLCSSDFFPQQGMRMGSMFYKTEDGIFLNLPFIPSVYKLEENSSHEVYRISIENHSFASREWLKTKAESNYMNAIINSNYISAYTIRETASLLTISFYEKGNNSYIGFYNKQTKDSYLYKTSDFIKATSLVGLGRIQNTYKDYFIATLNPDVLKRYSSHLAELNALKENLAEDSNPILCLIK